ncbi:tail spike protein [Pedobacter sp. GSP4]|uniref:tail spike protein n=1 Tax=Pedobacter sp. GSP4 TaxID=3453716 RepID=UPI003EEF298E
MLQYIYSGILFSILSLGINLHFNNFQEKDYVNVRSFGAKGNGINDDSNAILRATKTGKIVRFGIGRFLVRKPIKVNGKVRWLGMGKKSIIISDINVLFVSNGSYSSIASLTFKNVSVPFIIKRELFSNKKPEILKSNGNGYQPTINDRDIWNDLPGGIKVQNIGPSIIFEKGSNILIDKLEGNFMSVMLHDCQKSVVRNCIFRGGRNTFGSIVINNLNDRGYYNLVSNNRINYTSNNGIVFLNNQNGSIIGNRCEYNGESGIKLYQGKIDRKSASCYSMIIKNNIANYNIYDGFDLQSENPRTGKIKSGHMISGNVACSNSGVGFIVDGNEIVFQNNSASNNFRDGVNAYNNNSIFKKNTFVSNNFGNIETGVHQLNLIGGEGNLIEDNIFRLAPNMGYIIYSNNGNNVVEGNRYLNGKAIIYLGGKLIMN